MRVRVLRRHIEKANRSRTGKNPVEIALKEAGLRGVEVCSYDVEFTRGNKKYSVPLPFNAEDFVYSYEHGEDVSPITFNLDLSQREPAYV
jgi:hypothetical protein